MPTYDYRCTGCGKEQEEFHSIAKTPTVRCRACGKRAKRLISGGTGFLLKGHGWEADNYTLASEKPLDETGVMDYEGTASRGTTDYHNDA